jgi:proteasome lid subunit RPN8/RPN11
MIFGEKPGNFPRGTTGGTVCERTRLNNPCHWTVDKSKGGINMNEIMITKQALSEMWEHSRDCPTETGGALVGSLKIPLVLSAGGPGPQAVERPSSFSSDVNHDRLYLEQVRTLSERQVSLLGWWHKHPQGMTHPSGGDLEQARCLQEALLQAGDGPAWLLVFILQTASNPLQAVFPYCLLEGERSFRRLKLNPVDNEDPQVLTALEKESLLLRQDKVVHPWMEPGFRFQNTLTGRRRLEEEQRLLSGMGWHVEVRLRKDDERLSFTVSREEKSFLCIFPVEYPFGMPRLFRLPDFEEVYPLAGAPVWNSDFHLVEWLKLVDKVTDPMPRHDYAQPMQLKESSVRAVSAQEALAEEGHFYKHTTSDEIQTPYKNHARWSSLAGAVAGGILGVTLVYGVRVVQKIHNGRRNNL